MNKEFFENKIVSELQNDNLVLFAGAGVSIGSGFVSWKELVKEIAEEIGLCVEREHDLISVAQYHYNCNSRNRNDINQKILNEFKKKSKGNPVLNIISRLPIEIIWTTNYDRLIEQTYESIDKVVDVKKDINDLTYYTSNRDLVLYKMHGDVETPNDAVIIRDDYEAYEEKRGLFTTNLLGQMVSKTFLFIGYSFGDPNFEKMLSRIRLKLNDNKRTHYNFMKKIKLEECKDEEEFKYQENKQQLMIKDLEHYSVKTLLVDEYSEINDILERIERKLKQNNIFISGSATEYSIFGNTLEASTFIKTLSCKIIEKKYKIFSGYGLGVGSYVIEGAMQGILFNELSVHNHFELRPFPQKYVNSQNRKEVWSSYRKRILGDCSIALFIFGNKVDKSGAVIEAVGMLQEFEIAKELGLCIIPIGATGYVAKKILNEVKTNIDNYPYLKDSLSVLEIEKDVDKLVKEINKIIELYNKGWQ